MGAVVSYDYSISLLQSAIYRRKIRLLHINDVNGKIQRQDDYCISLLYITGHEFYV